MHIGCIADYYFSSSLLRMRGSRDMCFDWRDPGANFETLGIRTPQLRGIVAEKRKMMILL